MTSSVHIGTSGWHYQHWKGTFYSSDIKPEAMLRAYVQHFGSVEINNSFYRLPTTEAVKSWVKQTPGNFVFTVKASRYITHNRKLKYPKESLAKFLAMAKGFGKKLGCILFQLPPGWNVNADRLAEFLEALPTRFRYAFEFRNESWQTASVMRLLTKYNAAFCIFELNGFRSAATPTADFVYVRLHGPGNAYQGEYSEASLREWARKIESWKMQMRDVYFYFDNDQAGYAARNALTLGSLVGLDLTRQERSTG
ncbi:MAG TPA: DUF72 domain-containing protein [Terriglobales bacterium]|nr:DUF72 domain-containing protein [Terriglobales bacterium]